MPKEDKPKSGQQVTAIFSWDHLENDQLSHFLRHFFPLVLGARAMVGVASLPGESLGVLPWSLPWNAYRCSRDFVQPFVSIPFDVTNGWIILKYLKWDILIVATSVVRINILLNFSGKNARYNLHTCVAASFRWWLLVPNLNACNHFTMIWNSKLDKEIHTDTPNGLMSHYYFPMRVCIGAAPKAPHFSMQIQWDCHHPRWRAMSFSWVWVKTRSETSDLELG